MPLLPFALVVFLRRAPGDELHALGDDVWACVIDQKMDVIRGDHIIEHAKTETLLRLEQPVQVAASILLRSSFHGQKAASKLLNDAFYAYLRLINQAVGWVRPQTQ
jgi:hypothetical protein